MTEELQSLIDAARNRFVRVELEASNDPHGSILVCAEAKYGMIGYV